MKDSGIAWVGKIPQNWISIKAKYVIYSNDGGVWGDDPTNSDTDKVVLRSTEQTIDGKWEIIDPAKRRLSAVSYKNYIIKPDDLLITKSSGSTLHIGKTTLADSYFLQHECYYSNFLQRIRLKKTYSPKFAWYIFNSIFVREQFAYLQNATSGLGNINSKDIENVYIPTPPLNEQQYITCYLDRECEKIDSLKADIQTQIDWLEQYKRSVITEVVTHGLNPSAPMKNSGIIWAKNIPIHWKTMPNKHILKKTKNICSEYKGEDILSLTMNGVIVRDLDAGGKMPTSFDGYQYVQKGNLLMCLFDIDVTPRCIGIIKQNGVTSPAYSQFKTTNIAFADYYYYYYLMLDYTKELLHLAKNLRHSLTEEQLGAIKQLVPPLDEQKAIAEYLDNKCTEIEQIINDKKAQLETLDEYKKSLIYEYVTGKKEVV
ncbi:MAG: restriction endonuclease subunit S [Clostridia bacterium]|nr:restriction endonuclease subunit S [Clostridia bacterium]